MAFKTIEIENKIKPLKDDHSFFMVDLKVDNQEISTGEEPISSHYFWEGMRDASNKAIHRIEKNNPRINFSFSLSTLGQSKEQKEENFRRFARSKHPDLDVDKIFNLIDTEVKDIKLHGPADAMDDHPNPDMLVKPNDDLIRMLILTVIEKNK